MDVPVPYELSQLLDHLAPSMRDETWTAFVRANSKLILYVAHSFGGDHDDVMDPGNTIESPGLRNSASRRLESPRASLTRGGGDAMRIIRGGFLMVAGLLSLSSCGGGGGDAVGPSAPVPVASVTVSPGQLSLLVGQIQQFTATTKDASGNVLSGRTVTWASSAPGVGTVSATGLVTGVSAGSATITATSEGQSGTATVTSVSLVFAGVSAGGGHTCGLTTGGAAYCWGDNFFYQLGDGSIALGSTTPVPVAGGLTFASVRAGVSHSCGLTTGGAAYCWGRNTAGELGNGSTNFGSSAPVPVSGGLSFTAVSAGLDFAPANQGGAHSCGLTTSGAAYCWGGNSRGQLGNGSTAGSSVPVLVSGGLSFSAVSAGDGFTCGMTTSGAAYCWGGNSFGELGIGSTADSPTPALVVGGHTFATVSAGSGWTCGVTTNGAAYCWGVNTSGNLGNGSTTSSSVPVPVSGGLSFAGVSAGGAHTCGVTTGAAAYCWGNSTFGQLGNGATTNTSVPVPVSGGLSFAAVSAGSGHTCGVTSSGTVYCWGFNAGGELGSGATTDRAVPTKVVGQQ
jgi:alpha-tubulin suppressor-like RCC1 family protein